MKKEAQLNLWRVARWLLAGVLCLCGVVLLVAEKTAAGVSLVGVGLIVVVPLDRLITRRRVTTWIRVGISVALLAVATVGIAGTDLRPDQVRTGFPPADKVAAIVESFVEKISGTSPG